MILLAMESMGLGGFWIGAASVGMEKTIDRLGIEGVTSLMFSSGGGGGARIGRVYIGGAGFGASATFIKGGITYGISYDGGFFRFGYYPVVMDKFQLGVIGGIGGVNYQISMKKSSKTVNFDQLENQIKTTGDVTVSKLDLTTGATTGMLALSFEFPVRLKPKKSPSGEKGYFILVPALEVGAIYVPPLSPWQGPGITVEGLPVPSEGTPLNYYAVFKIYFGGGGQD